MDKLCLKTGIRTDFTMLSNAFIDSYMVDANGEYVKVYIYLLRCLSDNRKLSLNELSLSLDLTTKEIKMAIRYWTDKKLLIVQKNETGTCEIIFSNPGHHKSASQGGVYSYDEATKQDELTVDDVYDDIITSDIADNQVSGIVDSPKETVLNTNVRDINSYVPAKKINVFLEQEDIKRMLYVAQQYLGRPLGNTDIQTLIFMYDKLNFNPELIEHLIVYCVTNHKTSMNYIEKVALDWASKGVDSVDSAKLLVDNYSKEYITILKSLGINGRTANGEESKFIKKWLKEWKFEVEIVLKACDKTMMTAAKPSFHYVDSILDSWYNAGAKTLQDIEALDLEFKKKKKKVRAVGGYDFEDIDNKYDQLEINLQNKRFN